MSAFDVLARRLRMLVDRTVGKRISYEGKVRVVQVAPREGVAFDGLEHVEAYGFTSHALPGMEAITLNPGGNSGRAIVIFFNDRQYKLVLEEGEVAVYQRNGDFVHLKNGGEIHVKAASKVVLEAPLVECSQNLHVIGNVTIDGAAQIHGAVTMLNTLNVAMTATLQAGLSIAGNTTSTGNLSTSGHVIAGGVSLRAHTHGGVQSGSSNTGGPT